MGSVLDIDLDYFNLVNNPRQELINLLMWGNKSVEIIVENHNEVLPRLKKMLNNKKLDELYYILHVDEHHDLMDEKNSVNIANFSFHVMTFWENCKLHWLVQNPIDTPEMWISDAAWNKLKNRFTYGETIPEKWPKPDIVSICKSPEFINKKLLENLIEEINIWNRNFKETIEK